MSDEKTRNLLLADALKEVFGRSTDKDSQTGSLGFGRFLWQVGETISVTGYAAVHCLNDIGGLARKLSEADLGDVRELSVAIRQLGTATREGLNRVTEAIRNNRVR